MLPLMPYLSPCDPGCVTGAAHGHSGENGRGEACPRVSPGTRPPPPGVGAAGICGACRSAFPTPPAPLTHDPSSLLQPPSLPAEGLT